MSTGDFLAHITAYLETIDAQMTALQRMREDGVIREEAFNEEMTYWAGMKELVEQVRDGLREMG